MVDDEYIHKLKNKRFNLCDKIKNWKKKGKDTSELERELDDVLQNLQDAGCVVWMQGSKRFPPPVSGSQQVIPKKPEPTTNDLVKKPEPIKPSSYVLNIAWTETNKGEDKHALEQLDDYLKTIAQADIYDDSCDSSENGFEIEHIIKYKYKTTEQVFNVIKTSAGFLIDKLQDPTKDCIEYYGKCLGGSD